MGKNNLDILGRQHLRKPVLISFLPKHIGQSATADDAYVSDDLRWTSDYELHFRKVEMAVSPLRKRLRTLSSLLAIIRGTKRFLVALIRALWQCLKALFWASCGLRDANHRQDRKQGM